MKKIGIVVVLLLAFAVGFVAMRPAEYRVERSLAIAAPANVVLAQISDFHKWPAWSPWADLDPNQKVTYDGTAGAPGSSMSWVGNDKVGEGKMALTAVTADKVEMDLQFIKPFEDQAKVELLTRLDGKGIVATWAISGHYNFMGKAMSVFMSMDKTMGPDFERGLAKLKGVAEEEQKKAEAAAVAAAAAAAANPAPAEAPPAVAGAAKP